MKAQIFESSDKAKEIQRKHEERQRIKKQRAYLRTNHSHCGICKTELKSGKGTHIDHCHFSGRIRGVLCNHCNLGLGHFKDNYELLLEASKYIIKNKLIIIT